MHTTFIAMIADESATSMVEFGLLIALIAMVAFTAIRTLGSSISSFFNSAAGSL